VEANTGLASCLDKLARLEKKVIPTDHFKVEWCGLTPSNPC